MQRNFDPMRKQVEAWQKAELTDVTAKVVIYEAFVEGKLEAPKPWLAWCMTSISSRSMRSSGRARSGVFRMHSRRPSNNWIRSRNLRPPPGWESFWSPGSRSRSSDGRCRSRADPIGYSSTPQDGSFGFNNLTTYCGASGSLRACTPVASKNAAATAGATTALAASDPPPNPLSSRDSCTT